MNKRDLIERIMELNRSARQEFLEAFSEKELAEYLAQLQGLDLSGFWSGMTSPALAAS
ncbi:MAG TPA: hypothetical protein P5081_04285 [Phycisphaerae bacterium]|nr:hypothetical protein [Phycisphaerae bacterium]HRW52079.1 hypothetical protein [Phycisphaerae bacterium]